MRWVHEGARDMARDIATSDAHLKRILKLDRLRLRGPHGAKDEFHLAAAAQNLRKLAKIRPIPLSGAAVDLVRSDFFNRIGR
jgi:hypothetical protein